ncbi:MAG: sugar phosphate isomerase/epimerase [Candidatus Brockarchaeota archaeon]|nr:sugar phosphate isomerase/epimerase [Candidatus Brockarchaeota archaeon]
MERARELDLDGVEILHAQMESEEREYVNELKRLAFSLGLDVYCLAIHQNFVKPSKEEREKNVRHTKRCLEIAHRLGAPSIRLNSGRWETVKSFDELMAKRGREPPISGYTEEDGFRWVVESIEECLPTAEELGVVMALENHWGLTSTPEETLRIVESVSSKWLRVLMDTGNFLEDTYASLRKIAPHAILVHAKTYYGGGVWYELDLDYAKILEILDEAGYGGYISIEFEGKEDPMVGVERTKRLLLGYFK